MVTGGYSDGSSLDSTEFYDPTNGHWRMSEAKLPSARGGGLRAATVDNRVLIFGIRLVLLKEAFRL